MNTRMFGKSSEKSLVPSDQLSIYDFGFNEAEFLAHGKTIEEPEIDEVVIRCRKSKGKRDEDLSGFEAIPVEHGLSDEELAEKFPEGYYELADEVYRKLEVEPAVFKVNAPFFNGFLMRPTRDIINWFVHRRTVQ